MDFAQLVRDSRTFRRFYEDRKVTKEQLHYLIDLTRFTPSGGNRMPLRYMTSTSPEINAVIFKNVGWAAYLPEWSGPPEGERPTGYIIMLRDTTVFKATGQDEGIEGQTIMLAASTIGLGGCLMGDVRRSALMKELAIPEKYEIALVIALGYPKEKVILEDTGSDGSCKYYRTADGTHHVPKPSFSQIFVKEFD